MNETDLKHNASIEDLAYELYCKINDLMEPGRPYDLTEETSEFLAALDRFLKL